MTKLYDIISVESLKKLSDLEKKEIMFDIILNGKYIYFDKFKKIFDDDITKYITSDEMLIYLPTNADAAMIEYILKVSSRTSIYEFLIYFAFKCIYICFAIMIKL